MPIHVDIKINSRLIETLHVGRMVGGSTHADSVNTYSAVLGSEIARGHTTPSLAEWNEGVKFTHRYGDGALRCVESALECLRMEEEEVRNGFL